MLERIRGAGGLILKSPMFVGYGLFVGVARNDRLLFNSRGARHMLFRCSPTVSVTKPLQVESWPLKARKGK